ncbi:MAG: hypothetical protein ISR58_11830 [Anaerolineales bacterium]|nr:hypothetical protein [Chloroflexota bacterium]MBL6981865.1 hypothetical protein [Anaerolineales bacterium]
MKIFNKQLLHFIVLILLLVGIYLIFQNQDFQAGQFLSISTSNWLWISIAVPILHQVYALFAWRGQLHYNWMKRIFGERAFLVWGISFFVLFAARPISVIGLAISNRYTIPIPTVFGVILAVLCTPPVIYLAYSIHKFFGIERALGIDHFEPEESKKRPFVREGIFRWTPNAMYKFGFLALWIPGLLLLSRTALLSALFSHLYIWVHFYFTELPDMRYIYGRET